MGDSKISQEEVDVEEVANLFFCGEVIGTWALPPELYNLSMMIWPGFFLPEFDEVKNLVGHLFSYTKDVVKFVTIPEGYPYRDRALELFPNGEVPVFSEIYVIKREDISELYKTLTETARNVEKELNGSTTH